MSTNSKIPNGPRRKMGASRHRKPSRRWTAHHEAAHAVASIRLGQDMTGRFATIKAHGKTLGVVSSEDPLCTEGHMDEKGVWVPRPESLDKEVVALLAGHFGSIRAGCPADLSREGASDDNEKVTDLLQFTSTNRTVLRKRAARIVERNWRTIQALAAEFLRHETLDGTEMEFIVAVSDGKPEAAENLARYRRLLRHRP